MKVALYNVNSFGTKMNLDLVMLAKFAEIVLDPALADVVLCWKNQPEAVEADKCVVIQTEPPAASNIKATYARAAEYRAFYTFDPESLGCGEAISIDPLCFPYIPGMKGARPIPKDLDGGIRFYFAGMKGNWGLHTLHGARCVYQKRYETAVALRDRYPGSMVVGKGFGEVTKSADKGFRDQKFADLDACAATFMLCFENFSLRNYVSEKIHDGFRSGLPFLYFGAPNISDLVPDDCFINLRRYATDDSFDYPSLFADIDAISTVDRLAMARRARQFSGSFDARFIEARRELTSRIIQRISAG